MTTPMGAPATSQWEEDGRRIGATLEGLGCIVVVGNDGERAAEVALGIARVQARRRRVAVGDLVGELPALQRLVPADSPHGIIDLLLHGVSLSKVAHPIDPAKNLYILPSGAGPVDHGALLREPQWVRLAESFRAADALLVLVVPARAEGLADFVAAAGARTVAVDPGRLSERMRVIHAVGEPRAAPPPPPADVSIVATPAAAGARSAASEAMVESQAFAPLPADGRRTRPAVWAGTTALLVAAIWLALWAAGRDDRVLTAGSVAPQTTARVDLGAGGVDTFAANAVSETAGVDPPGVSPAPGLQSGAGDPVDSANAAAFAVEIRQVGSRDEAATYLERNAGGLPAATLSVVGTPAPGGRSYTYPLLTGAYRDPAQADSLLRVLRRQGVLRPTLGSVVRAPYALLVDEGLSRAQAATGLVAHRARGLPVYALVQRDGTVRLYAGAFESTEQAALLSASLPPAQRRLRVTYRTGSVY